MGDPAAVLACWLGRLEVLAADVEQWSEAAGRRTRAVAEAPDDGVPGRSRVDVLLGVTPRSGQNCTLRIRPGVTSRSWFTYDLGFVLGGGFSGDDMVGYTSQVERLMQRLFGSLKESDRRRYAAIEVAKLGHGGTEYIAGLLGCDPKTIRRGVAELEGESELDPARSRKRGADASR